MASGSGFATFAGNTEHNTFCLDHTTAKSVQGYSSTWVFSIIIHFWGWQWIKLPDIVMEYQFCAVKFTEVYEYVKKMAWELFKIIWNMGI
jgi:hypothetical protein